jgi:hypothetical protein
MFMNRQRGSKTGSIEKQGIGLFQAFISQSRILEPYIMSNDKSPSWDGEIILYNSQKTKDDIRGIIPVQIKSTNVSNFHTNQRSFPVSKSDLRNFQIKNGTIFFVIEVIGMNFRVFFQSLLPSDIKHYLKIIRPGNKTLSIPLSELTTTSISELETECQYFVMNQELQASTKNYMMSLCEATELIIPVVFGRNPNFGLLNKDVLRLYGKRHENDVPIYIQDAKLSSITQTIQSNVSVNTDSFYSNYKITFDQSNRIIEFGNNIKIFTSEDRITYDRRGSVSEQINDHEFLVHLIQHQRITFGNEEAVFSLHEDATVVESFRHNLGYLKNVELLLQYFSIDPFLVDISDLSKNEEISLSYLIQLFVKKEVFTELPFRVGVNAVKFGNTT